MRYEECGIEVSAMIDKVIQDHFDELNGVMFKCVFDTKPKKKSGKYVVAQIKKVNDLVEFLASDEFNYLILIDKNIWGAVEDEADRKRILRHELHHVFLDNEAVSPYKIKDHDVEDFLVMVEDELKNGDPKWMQRISVIAETVYEKDEEND